MKILIAKESKFRGHLGSGSWTLCIGAGVSRGIVPTWNELTRRVINSVFSSNYTLDEFDKIVSSTGWGLDGWIQAAANEHKRLGNDIAEFHELLESSLYGDLISNAQAQGVEEDLVVALNDPGNILKDKVFRVCEFFENNYSNTSLLAVAKSLIRATGAPEKLPRSIINFNADTLLHTIIELFQRRDHYLGNPPHSHPKYIFKSIYRGIGGIPRKKIPILHCHGSIKPRTSVAGPNRYDSRDKLVFLEESYLRVATSASTWPETIFMYHAQTSKMLFVGLSMADANIRRWMATANQIEMSDLAIVARTDDVTPKHLWVTTNSGDEKMDEIKQVALCHLGVRPAWIDGWSDLESSMNNLLGV